MVRMRSPYVTMVLEASLNSSTPLGDVTSNCNLCGHGNGGMAVSEHDIEEWENEE